MSESDQGDCFEAALRVMAELTDDGQPGEVWLVHGRPVYQGKGPGEAEDGRFWHAWVERDGEVFDHANGREIDLPAELYYAVGRLEPEHVTYYSLAGAAVEMFTFGHCGPWDGSYSPIVEDDS